MVLAIYKHDNREKVPIAHKDLVRLHTIVSGISRRGDRMINIFQYFHIDVIKSFFASMQVAVAANILDKNTAKKTHNQFTRLTCSEK